MGYSFLFLFLFLFFGDFLHCGDKEKSKKNCFNFCEFFPPKNQNHKSEKNMGKMMVVYF